MISRHLYIPSKWWVLIFIEFFSNFLEYMSLTKVSNILSFFIPLLIWCNWHRGQQYKGLVWSSSQFIGNSGIITGCEEKIKIRQNHKCILLSVFNECKLFHGLLNVFPRSAYFSTKISLQNSSHIRFYKVECGLLLYNPLGSGLCRTGRDVMGDSTVHCQVFKAPLLPAIYL